MNAFKIIEATASILWPEKCAACNKRILKDGDKNIFSGFCSLCAESLEQIDEPFCTTCGLKLPSGITSHKCSQCMENTPPFAHARAGVIYGGAIQDALLRFKYRNAPHLARSLVSILVFAATELAPAEVIVPIPLHDRKLKARGYNQSALLAGHLSAHLDTPVLYRCLRRVHETYAQSRLSRKERMNNLKDVFVVEHKHLLVGRRVLLVDDVITTTATVRTASSALKEAGAANVDVVALARAGDLSELATLTKKSLKKQ